MPLPRKEASQEGKERKAKKPSPKGKDGEQKTANTYDVGEPNRDFQPCEISLLSPEGSPSEKNAAG